MTRLDLILIVSLTLLCGPVGVAVYAAEPSERPAVAKALRRSSGFLRRELGHLLGLRYAPELQFHYDDSFDRGARIDAILREIPEGKEGPDEG